MKKSLLIALSLLFTANVFAKDLASYRFAIRSGDTERTVIHSVVATVSDEAELTAVVTSHEGNWPIFFPNEIGGQEFTKKLNKHVFALLKNDIIRLSQAEIEHRTNQIVCMMMPGPTQSNNHLSVLRDYDWNTQTFKGEMELVDGPHGCWVRSATYPKNMYDRATATSLKGLMKALTLDSFGEELE